MSAERPLLARFLAGFCAVLLLLTLSLSITFMPIVSAAAVNYAQPLRLAEAELDYTARQAGDRAQQVTLPGYLPAAKPGQQGQLRFEFDVQQPKALLLYVEATREHFVAGLNGVLVFDSRYGDPDAPPLRSWRMSPSFELPSELLRTGRNELTLTLLSPPGRVLRIAPLWVGEPSAIEHLAFEFLLRDEIGPLAIVVVLITLATIALILARDSRDRNLLVLYAAGAFMYAAVTLGALLPAQPLPMPHYAAWWYALYLWSPYVVYLLALRFAGLHWLIYERVLGGLSLLALPLMYTVTLAGAGSGVYGSWLMLSNSLAIPLMFFLARRWLKDGNHRAAWMLTFIALCWFLAMHDIVIGFVLQHIIKNFLLAPYVGLVHAIWAGWILISRYRRTEGDLKQLNRELDARVRSANQQLHEQLAQVQQAHRLAEKASVAKSTFLAAVSHDLRQPLHSLGMFVSALEQHVSSDAGRQMQQRVHGSFSALEGLFNELLDLSRLDAGTVEVRTRPIELQPIFDRLGDLFHAEADLQGVGLRIVPTHCAVTTDPMLLERILANLVSNALRYSSGGNVLVGARRRGGDVLIEVRDSGIGIAAEQQNKIFEDFYQVDNPARDRRRGLGLGLAIVRRLALLLGHSVELRSQPGRGTVFGLRLRGAAAPAEPTEIMLTHVEHQTLQGRRVLVVDDEIEVRDASLALLALWGVEGIGASGADEVERMLTDGASFDAVIVDLRLGASVDGIELIERMREVIGATLPALLVSGDTGARELVRVKASGLSFLTKPVAPARLKATLHACLYAQGPARFQTDEVGA